MPPSFIESTEFKIREDHFSMILAIEGLHDAVYTYMHTILPRPLISVLYSAVSTKHAVTFDLIHTLWK